MSHGPDTPLRSVIAPPEPRQPDDNFTAYSAMFSDGYAEVLLEPLPGYGVREIDISGVTRFLGADIVGELEHFVWLQMPVSRLETLYSWASFDLYGRHPFDPDGEPLRPWPNGERASLKTMLREYRVERVWPNVAFMTQATDAYSLGPAHLSHALASIRLDVQPGDGKGVVWAILDLEVRQTHAHFRGATISRYEVTQSGVHQVGAAYGGGRSGHGTHVAGIIHALAPKAELRTLHCHVSKVSSVWDPNSSGFDGALIEKALDWVRGQKDIDGVNISLALDPPYQDPLVGKSPGCPGVDATAQTGTAVVVAAGNYGQVRKTFREISITDPANAREALVVGACATENPLRDGVWSQSSRGPTADGRIKPDVVAPGVDIESSSSRDDSKYMNLTGTSQAAALVSGASAALLSRARRAGMTVSAIDLVDLITQTADSLGTRDATHQGHGIIRADRVQSALGI
jgi:subtilisin family serine protease